MSNLKVSKEPWGHSISFDSNKKHCNIQISISKKTHNNIIRAMEKHLRMKIDSRKFEENLIQLLEQGSIGLTFSEFIDFLVNFYNSHRKEAD